MEFAVVFEGLVGPRLEQFELLVFDLTRRAGPAWLECSVKADKAKQLVIALFQFHAERLKPRWAEEFAFLTRQCGGVDVTVSALSSLERGNFLSQGKAVSRVKSTDGLRAGLDKLLSNLGLQRSWELMPLRVPLLLSHEGQARYDVRNRRVTVVTETLPPVGMELQLDLRLLGVSAMFRCGAVVTVVERRERRYGLGLEGLSAEEHAILAGFATSEPAPLVVPRVVEGRPRAQVVFETDAQLEADRALLARGALFARGVEHPPGTEVTTEVCMPSGAKVTGAGRVRALEPSGISIEISLDSLFALSQSGVIPTSSRSSRSVFITASALTECPVDTPPAQFGPWEVFSSLGRVGLAEVFYARHGETRRPAAIKRLAPEYAADPKIFELFALEGDVTRHLRHPNIVQTLDVGFQDGEYFLVTELVDGRSLAQVLARCRELGVQLPLDPMLMLMRCVLEGLAYTHEALGPRGDPLDIVHCDVAPSCVMVSMGGDIKLGDFSVASVRGSGVRSREEVRPHYLSPEAFEGDLSPARDVWAAAVTLYEALTLHLPWPEESLEALHGAIRSRPAPPLSVHRPEVPSAVEAVLKKALSLHPAERFKDAREFAAALEELTDPAVGTSLALASIVRGLFGTTQVM